MKKKLIFLVSMAFLCLSFTGERQNIDECAQRPNACPRGYLCKDMATGFRCFKIEEDGAADDCNEIACDITCVGKSGASWEYSVFRGQTCVCGSIHW